MKLRNLKKAPFEIATLLAGNPNIVRLIYDDKPSVLIDKREFTLSIEDLIEQNYIGFYPATESGIKEIDKNTFIIINFEDFSLQNTDNNIGVSGSIYITTDKSHCLLSENRLRLLELIDEIEETLENKKLSSAGQIHINSANYVVFSDFRSGYRINLRIYDQQTRKAEL
jgi:hypothetical protein